MILLLMCGEEASFDLGEAATDINATVDDLRLAARFPQQLWCEAAGAHHGFIPPPPELQADGREVILDEMLDPSVYCRWAVDDSDPPLHLYSNISIMP